MIKTIIKDRLVPSQDYIFGFVDLRGMLNKKFDNFQFGISIGKKLDDNIIDNLDCGPTIEYYNYYNQINRELADLTKKFIQI